MKKITQKMMSFIIMPVLLLLALLVWLGGAGGGPKTVPGFLLGALVLVVAGIPLILVTCVLLVPLSLLGMTSRKFNARMNAMKKRLKRD